MLQQLKRLDYLINQINDEELKSLIIDTSMEILKLLPDYVIEDIKEILEEDNSNG